MSRVSRAINNLDYTEEFGIINRDEQLRRCTMVVDSMLYPEQYTIAPLQGEEYLDVTEKYTKHIKHPSVDM